jgi:arylsulfatase A-like enzyme
MRNETVLQRVKPEDQVRLVELYTQEAVRFIRAKKDAPFFLYLPHNSVHFPLYPGDAFRGKSANGLYGDWVEETDASVGRLLDAIREAGIASRTLVIFTSDNGGTSRGLNTPFRGHKGSTLEGGMRVPTIAWWPGRVPAGAKTDVIAGMLDVLPTLARLSGADLPKDRKIDGVDLVPVLEGREGARGRDSFYYYRGLVLEAVRSGPWKLHLAKGELYRLDEDPGEAKDVAAGNPKEVERLRALADLMKDDLGAEGIGPGCRPLGKVEQPRPLIGQDGTVREGFRPN